MLAAFLAAAATPVPAELRTFQDWTVACDNGRACEAVALLPENRSGDDDWAQWVTLMLRRGPAAHDPLVALIQNVDGDPAVLLIDGEPLAARFAEEIDGARIEAEADALADALRRGRVMEIRGAGGERLGLVSLAGASAAMLYMDEAQRRLGTVTALVRRGTRPASAVPAPPPVPEVRVAPAASDRAVAVQASDLADFRRRFECADFDVRDESEFQVLQIATGTTLVLMPCGSGAYNFSSVPLIAERSGGGVTVRVAPFDAQWGIAAEGHPVLVNPDWDSETRRLGEYRRGRGLGDCGTRSQYVWDGQRFRLVQQDEMGECRGSLYYVTTWRAETVEP